MLTFLFCLCVGFMLFIGCFMEVMEFEFHFQFPRESDLPREEDHITQIMRALSEHDLASRL